MAIEAINIVIDIPIQLPKERQPKLNSFLPYESLHQKLQHMGSTIR